MNKKLTNLERKAFETFLKGMSGGPQTNPRMKKIQLLVREKKEDEAKKKFPYSSDYIDFLVQVRDNPST